MGKAPLKRRSIAFYSLLAAVAMAVLGFGVAYVYMPSSATASVLRTTTVTRGNVQTTETATGNISSASSATVGFPVSGTLTQINVSLGSKVQAGEVLAKIDPSSAEIALTAAQAALASAEENLTTAKEGGSAASKTSDQSNLENAESTLTDDEQQLTTDNTDLATARQQLLTDKNLGCPAAGSSTVTSAISGNTSGSGSSSSTSSSSSQGSTTNSGAGSSSSTFHASLIRPDSKSYELAMKGDKTIFYIPNYLNKYLQKSLSKRITESTSLSADLVISPATSTTLGGSVPAQSTASSDTLPTTTTTTTTTTLPPTTPDAITGSVTNLMTDQATLDATVSPNGATTSYYFAWGPTDKLANHTPVQTLTATTGTSSVSADISGLKVDTNYLFRVIATNSVGVSKGLSQLFTTPGSSCTEEESVITEDESAIAKQKVIIQQAKTNLAATQASITQSNQNNSVSISSDEATVAEDQANVATDEKDLQETTLTAPIDGTITSLNYSLGESVSPYSSSASNATGSSGRGGGVSSSASSSSSSSSAGFATITNLNNFEVIASMAEADISQIAPGQQATITLPALPNVTVTGKVTYISDISTVSSNVVTYDVTIQVIDPPSTLKDGMTADISILTGSADNVLTIPSAAITTNGSVSTVTTYLNGTRHRQVVKVGLIGSSTTQIISGLQLGQTVILPSIQASTATGSSTSSVTPGAGGTVRFGGGGFGGGGFGGGGFGG